MKKIISLFQRNYAGDRLVRDEVCVGAEWVLAGEGIATVKLDGTCCMIRDGKLYARYDAKAGRKHPANFEPAQPDGDPVTGHWPGWVPVNDEPQFRWHREAFIEPFSRKDGTYELVGPKVQGNPECLHAHHLMPHGAIIETSTPRTYSELKAWFADKHIEGIVWHNPDGRMVKIKRKDFGYPWPIKK